MLTPATMAYSRMARVVDFHQYREQQAAQCKDGDAGSAGKRGEEGAGNNGHNTQPAGQPAQYGIEQSDQALRCATRRKHHAGEGKQRYRSQVR
jgi:hypothetical protein